MPDRRIVKTSLSLEVFHCVTEEELTVPLKARDYKDPLVVVYEEVEDDISKSNRATNGKRLPKTRDSRSPKWDVCS